jgi:hypothetical protein
MENNGQTTFSPCTLLRNRRNDDRQMKIAGTILLGTQAVAQCAAHTRKTWSVPFIPLSKLVESKLSCKTVFDKT